MVTMQQTTNCCNNLRFFLYILAHLDKIEDYAKSQVTSDNKSINALHYKDILQRVKKIRDEYNKANK
jgi:hypothetical protein